MTKIVKEIESNDADVLNFLASGKSFEQYERDRLFTFNIDTEEAEKLMIKRCNKENADVIKRKKHHGHFSRYLFEKEKFLQDIRSLKPASHVNWQSMAKKYQIQTKNGVFPLNGSQILKEFAKQNGINTNHFNNHVRVSGRDYLRRARRAKKRLTSKVAIPFNRSSKHIKAIVKEKVRIGDFNIGRKIVPTAITTNIIDKTGKKNTEGRNKQLTLTSKQLNH